MTPSEQRRTRAYGPALSLGDFIRDRQEDILAEWAAEARKLPNASTLDRLALIDHLPDVLDRIAEMADSIAKGEPAQSPTQEADLHALIRLDEGFDLPQVVAEFTILRNCVMRLWQQNVVDPTHVEELLAINLAIDKAVTASVDRFTRARDRTLVALDRIASEALESRSLDELLQRLLKVFVEFTAAVDTAAILIREGDVLRVRAALGLQREREVGLVMKIGQGFAGRIANDRKPIAIASGSAVPFIQSEILRTSAIRALYGVPLIDCDRLLGVAHMGSLTANDFSMQDKRLLSAMANRASFAISQHVLREEAEKTSAELSAILESMPAAVFIGDAHGITRANRAGLDLLGYEDADQLARQPVSTLVEALDMRDAATGDHLDPENGPVRTAAQGTHYQHDVIVRDRTTAKDVIMHAVAAPIMRDGNVTGAVSVAVDVTARRRMEEALRERELEFRTLAENIPQLVWISDKDGTPYWFNQRWLDYTGLTVADGVDARVKRLHHEEHVKRVTQKYRAAIELEQRWEDTYPMRGKDGIFRWFLARAVPVRDEAGRVVRWFGTCTDVTEQRFLSHASDLLAASLDMNETLEQLAKLAVPELADLCAVDLLMDGNVERVAIAHFDPAKEATVREWSRRYPSKLDAPGGIGEVIRTGQPVFYPHYTDAHLVAIARDAEHLRLMRELGLVSTIIAPLVAHGRTLGAITLSRAQSGRHYSQSKLETAIELGNRAGFAIDNARLYKEAQDATRAREEILAIVSHDLRNPLQSIDLGAVIAIESGDVGPKARKPIEMIHRNASRMEHLLRDLLDATSAHAGRLTLEKKIEDATALMMSVKEAYEQLADQQHIEMICDCDLNGAQIFGDRSRLIQAFGNLVGNAIKFCSPGDVVTLRGRSEGRNVIFTVADTGPGIGDDDVPHIFEPYWSAKRHANKGTGLGLYICQAIVEGHRGEIVVESKVGHGTTFTMTFPIA